MRRWLFPLFWLLTLAFPAQAQERIVLQLGVSEFDAPNYTGLVERFEAAQPTYTFQIRILPSDLVNVSPDQSDYVARMRVLATQADVILTNTARLTPLATRAGIFRDLRGLIAADSSLNPADFHAPAWQSFVWDDGSWALPLALEVMLISYDPAAFDAAGLMYPAENWTLDEFANAAQELAAFSGAAGMMLPRAQLGGFLRSVLNEPFYDDTSLPETTRLTSPALVSVLELWGGLMGEGVVIDSAASSDLPPLAIIPQWMATNATMDNAMTPNAPITAAPRAYLALPNNGVVGAKGYAVSAGTLAPEGAYALATFLTNQPELAYDFESFAPARRTFDASVSLNGYAPEAHLILIAALENGLPASESRYDFYLLRALDAMRTQGIGTQAALDSFQAQALDELANAVAEPFSVIPPEQTIDVEGEITLYFGVSSSILPLPDRAQWEMLAADFAAADGDVATVVINEVMNTPLETDDCAYSPGNLLNTVPTERLLPLDPLLQVDPDFIPSDLVNGVLTLTQRDGITRALPLGLAPLILRYDPAAFAAAGLAEPLEGWSVDQFIDALSALQADPSGITPFTAGSASSTSVLMLIAAYGGLPLDYRTSPPTASFTDPAVVNAIRQVLDLARSGTIAYIPLSQPSTAPASAVIVTDVLGPSIFSFADRSLSPAPFPQGQIPVAAANLSTGAIRVDTPYAEACYRWLRYISAHVDGFGLMPVEQTLIALQPAPLNAAYAAVAAQMADPQMVIFPTGGGGWTEAGFLTQFLNAAFDAYVLSDADLDTVLADAQWQAEQFLACTAGLPGFETPQDEAAAIHDCATTVSGQ
jgi:ABC-type glycerol-3-phosphate transport system substrate-binding protein